MRRRRRKIDLSEKDDKLNSPLQGSLPPRFSFYDFVGIKGEERFNEIKKWFFSLQKKHLARLNSKLDQLLSADYGHRPGLNEISPHLLTDTSEPHIKEIRINCEVAIRLMVCRGPINVENEATFLIGGFERDSMYVPSNILDIAEHRRNIIIEDPSRRVIHERVDPKIKK